MAQKGFVDTPVDMLSLVLSHCDSLVDSVDSAIEDYQLGTWHIECFNIDTLLVSDKFFRSSRSDVSGVDVPFEYIQVSSRIIIAFVDTVAQVNDWAGLAHHCRCHNGGGEQKEHRRNSVHCNRGCV